MVGVFPSQRPLGVARPLALPSLPVHAVILRSSRRRGGCGWLPLVVLHTAHARIPFAHHRVCRSRATQLSIASAAYAFNAPAPVAPRASVSMMAKSKALPWQECPAVRNGVSKRCREQNRCAPELQVMRHIHLTVLTPWRPASLVPASRGYGGQCRLRSDGPVHAAEHQVDARG